MEAWTLRVNAPREWYPALSRRFDQVPLQVLLVAPAVAFVALVLLTNSWALHGFALDLELYRAYGFRIADGLPSSTWLRMEYPPLSIVPMLFPRIFFGTDEPSVAEYMWRFLAVAAVITVGCGWAVYRAAGQSRTALASWSAMICLSCISAALRFDIWPVALTLVAFLVARRHPGLAGVLLGLGTMLKLYPIVVIGVLAARLLANRDGWGLVRLVAGCGMVCAVVTAWSWNIAGPDSLGFLSYQGDRGLQIESLGSSLVLAIHLLTGAHVEPVFGFGSTQIAGPGSDLLVAISTPLLGLLVVGAGLLALRRFVIERAMTGSISRDSLALACAAAITAVLLGNKVLSLQYILWLAPFVPFLPVRLRWLVLGIAGLSTWIFEFDYAGLWAFRPWMLVALIVRNALLVWLGVQLATGLWRVRRETASRPTVERSRPLPARVRTIHGPAYPHLPAPGHVPDVATMSNVAPAARRVNASG